MAFVAMVIATPVIVKHRGPRTVLAEDRQRILELMRALRAAWQPKQRAQILEAARAEAERFATALHWLLAQPGHAEIRDAIALAEELRVPSTLPDLVGLTAVPELRPRALLAADRVQPWPLPELELLFDDEEAEVQLAAVQMAERRADRPVGGLLRLLRDPRAELRKAALAALPERLDPKWLDQILAIAEYGDPELASDSLRALQKLPITADTEATIVRLLRFAAPEVAEGALAALASKDAPLNSESVEVIWWRITIAERGGSLLPALFTCLERTLSIDPEVVSSRVASLDPLRRYYAARLLLRIGDGKGLELLFSLVDDIARHDDPAECAVLFACRSLLGSLANLPAATPIGDFRRYFRQHPPTGPRDLPPPTL
ncbi:MAG: hypothetical protein R3F56_16555 [Planctomycetota bacterium]